MVPVVKAPPQTYRSSIPRTLTVGPLQVPIVQVYIWTKPNKFSQTTSVRPYLWSRYWDVADKSSLLRATWPDSLTLLEPMVLWPSLMKYKLDLVV